MPFSLRAQRTGESPIASLMALTIADPEILSLAAGFVDTSTLPEDLVRKAVDAVFADPKRARESLQYGSTPGLTSLRKAMVARLTEKGVPAIDASHMVISNGGQQGLFTVTDAMVDPGDIVLVEDPTYFVYMNVLQSVGARSMGVATDDEGMVPEALERRFEEIRKAGLRGRLKILYVMSYYSNPKGTNMSSARRKAIWDVYQRELEHGHFLMIEDASYCDLCIEGRDEPFIKSYDVDNEFVFLTGTFSKAFAPGFRLGWSVMPPDIHTAVVRQKANQDFGSSNLNQSLLTYLIESGAYDDAANRFRTRYRAKRDAMLSALHEFWPSDAVILKPYGGLYVWAQLPGINVDPGSPFFNACLKRKVIYIPSVYCYCDEPQNKRPLDVMRLCYGVIDIEPMREAIRRMGEAIAEVR